MFSNRTYGNAHAQNKNAQFERALSGGTRSSSYPIVMASTLILGPSEPLSFLATLNALNGSVHVANNDKVVERLDMMQSYFDDTSDRARQDQPHQFSEIYS